MATTATASGTFKIGGDLEVTRLGYGAMRITGDGIWGPPADHDKALDVLRKLPDLGVDAIDLWQLHRIDSKVPREEQFGVMKELQDEGKVRHLGLSEVSVDDIKEAGEYFDVATVQNLYNLTNRDHEDVL